MTETGQKGDTSMLNTEGRHPALAEFHDMFEFGHLPEGLPRECSESFHTFAQALLDNLPDGPQLTRSLHRLWEAKNEAVFLAVRTNGSSKNEPVRRIPPKDRPNHLTHDGLGDPATCAGDHNHPPKDRD